jgi:Mg-chelatase subunit ChlD
MVQSSTIAFLFGVLALATAGCDSSKFSGTNNNLRSKLTPKNTGDGNSNGQNTDNVLSKNGQNPYQADLKILCPANPDKDNIQKSLTLKSGTETKIAGEICLQQNISGRAIDFVFVVDKSGSMATNDNACKRREAVAAVIQKIAATKSPNDDLRFGFVKFSSSSSIVQNLTDLTKISEVAKGDSICRIEGSTNYENAFRDTKNVLEKSGTRQKIVYFLSDGLPTEDNSSGTPSESGLKAADELFKLGNVQIFSIFLNDNSSSSRSYLEKISRDKDNVRTVSKADDLVSEILKFEVPKGATLNAADVQLSVAIDGGNKETIGIASLTQSQTDPKIWYFLSSPFVPKKEAGNEMNAVISVSANPGGFESFANSENFKFRFE